MIVESVAVIASDGTFTIIIIVIIAAAIAEVDEQGEEFEM